VFYLLTAGQRNSLAGGVLEANKSTINVTRLEKSSADDVIIDVMKVDVEGADT